MRLCDRCGSPLASSSPCPACKAAGPAPYVGRILLRKYRCVAHLATRGPAEIYRVEHVDIAKPRALKALRVGATSAQAAAFRREARVAANLRHPNLAIFHDFDTLEDGALSSTWEMIEGRRLSELVAERALGPFAFAVILGLIEALNHMHERSVALLSLNPSDIRLLPRHDGTLEPRITDFSQARPLGLPQGDRTGLLPGFAAPEQLVEGRELDAAADVFTLGALIVYAYTGKPPIQAHTLEAYQQQLRLFVPSRSTQLAWVPTAVQPLVEQCLDPDPANRPLNLLDLRDRLSAAMSEASLPLLQMELPAPPPMTATSGTDYVERIDSGTAAWGLSEPPARVPEAADQTGTASGNTATHVLFAAQSAEPESPPLVAPAPMIDPDGSSAATEELGSYGDILQQWADGVTTGAPEPAPPPMPSARLESTTPGFKPITLLPTTTLGRAPENAVRLEHPTVSKRHAEIVHRDGKFVLQDLGSRNGCHVNGALVTAATELRPGDRLMIGDLVFDFRLG